MNVILGLIIIAIAIGLAVTVFGMVVDGEIWMGLGLAIVSVTLVLSLVGFGIGLILGVDLGPRLVEGACYRAVGQNTVVPITTGKVTTIVPMHNIDLVEIRCP